MKRITVLLAEDHAVVREGLRALLDLDPGIEVVGEAKNGREAVLLASKHRPAVALLDIGMPDLNGVEATRQIRKAAPATRVLVLSAHDDDAYVDRALEMGAAGYMLKQSSASMLLGAIREVNRGKPFFSPPVLRRLRQRDQTSPNRKGFLKKLDIKLSPREAEALQLIAEGKANKQIAAELGISIKTVEKHRQHLMKKLDIHETAGLTRYAMAAGIIEGGGRLIAD